MWENNVVDRVYVVHPSEVREVLSDKREIGKHAVWSLSSAKPGFGVEQLRDDNLDTYWQLSRLGIRHVSADGHSFSL